MRGIKENMGNSDDTVDMGLKFILKRVLRQELKMNVQGWYYSTRESLL